MKYKKVIIDGKEYLEIVEENEMESDPECEGETVDAQINDSEEPDATEKFKRDTKEFFTKIGEGAKNIGTKIGEGAKSFGEKVTRDFKDAGKKLKEGTERLFAKDKTLDPNSKEAKLIKLLPYMSESEAHAAAEKILASDEALLGVDISLVMPYLTAEDCGSMFVRCLELGRNDLDLAMATQYIDRSVLTQVVDDYISGKYPKLDIDALYPFLDDSDIKRIFYHIAGE